MLTLGRTLFTIILLLHKFHVVISTGNAPRYVNPSSAGTETVFENADASTAIFTVVVQDDEGDTLTHSLYSQTPNTPSFTFDAVNRKLYPPANLDAETTASFTIEFNVTDGTSTVISPVLTFSILDVNEHSPTFTLNTYSATIYDTASNGDVVLTVNATDQDIAAALTYSITAGDSTTFSIDPSSGAVSVATAGNLNAATTPSYTLTVQVSDTSNTDTATVSISVLDDPCLPNPCDNSGSCSSSGTSFTCTCQTGWIGATCNTSPCIPNPCENSGNCTVSGTSYQCLCSSDYSGKNCTDEVKKGGTDDEDDNGLSGGVIAGICIACVTVIVLTSLLVFTVQKMFLKKKEKELTKVDFTKNEHFAYKRNSVSPTNFESQKSSM